MRGLMYLSMTLMLFMQVKQTVGIFNSVFNLQIRLI
jgi:hypothetical protein